MERFERWLIRVLKNERGQDMVEYALVITTISVPIVLAAIVIPPVFTTWAEQVAGVITGA